MLDVEWLHCGSLQFVENRSTPQTAGIQYGMCPVVLYGSVWHAARAGSLYTQGFHKCDAGMIVEGSIWLQRCFTLEEQSQN